MQKRHYISHPHFRHLHWRGNRGVDSQHEARLQVDTRCAAVSSRRSIMKKDN